LEVIHNGWCWFIPSIDEHKEYLINKDQGKLFVTGQLVKNKRLRKEKRYSVLTFGYYLGDDKRERFECGVMEESQKLDHLEISFLIPFAGIPQFSKLSQIEIKNAKQELISIYDFHQSKRKPFEDKSSTTVSDARRSPRIISKRKEFESKKSCSEEDNVDSDSSLEVVKKSKNGTKHQNKLKEQEKIIRKQKNQLKKVNTEISRLKRQVISNEEKKNDSTHFSKKRKINPTAFNYGIDSYPQNQISIHPDAYTQSPINFQFTPSLPLPVKYCQYCGVHLMDHDQTGLKICLRCKKVI